MRTQLYINKKFYRKFERKECHRELRILFRRFLITYVRLN